MPAAKSRVLVLRSAADVLQLRRRPRGIRALKIETADVPPEVVARWQTCLAADLFECGCEAGRYGVLLGLLLCACGAVALWQRVAGEPWIAAAVMFALVVALANGLRAATLLRAKARLSRSIDRIACEWADALACEPAR